MKVVLQLDSVDEMIKQVGLDKGGVVQNQLNFRAAVRMDKYIPSDTMALRKSKDYDSDPEGVIYDTPYAQKMYYGVTRKGKPINYSGAPQRGAFWDEKMMAAEGDELVKDMQKVVDRMK